MTDKEIIKALECCINVDCLNCPRWTEEWASGTCGALWHDTIDLINRQKAEIDELNRELRRAERYLNQIADDWEDWDD